MLGLRSLTTALFLLSPVAGAAGDRPVVILLDRGGPVIDRIAEIEAYALTNTRVEVFGECYSSCTLFAGLPGVCTYPEATWFFHGPFSPLGISEDYFELLTTLMAQFYPADMRQWWFDYGRWIPADEFFPLTGEDMHTVGIPYCETAQP